MTVKIRQLNEIMRELSKEDFSLLLSDFKCSRNMDTEDFLKKSSIRHEMRDISRTYLAMDADDHEQKILGYFTLTLKCLSMNETELSPELIRSMNMKQGVAQAYLIGQLARADDAVPGLGKKMLDEAMNVFTWGKSKFGCRMVRLDCKDELIDYYASHGFQIIGKNYDRDLNQMAIFM